MFPSRSQEDLAEVDEGEIQQPQQGPHDGRGDRTSLLRLAAQRKDRERDARPGADAKCGVRGREKEKARRRAERDKLSKAGHRQETTFAEQRHELVGRDGEPDQVHRRECTLEQEARYQ